MMTVGEVFSNELPRPLLYSSTYLLTSRSSGHMDVVSYSSFLSFLFFFLFFFQAVHAMAHIISIQLEFFGFYFQTEGQKNQCQVHKNQGRHTHVEGEAEHLGHNTLQHIKLDVQEHLQLVTEIISSKTSI